MTDIEKATLECRIDELCAEVERLRVANAAFTGRSIRAGDKMACLEAENAKLREFAGRMANALGINRKYCVTSWCDVDCMVEFGCQSACETRCPAWAKLIELGIEGGDNGMEA